MPAGADLARKAVAAGYSNAAELLWRASDEALGFPASWITTAEEVDAVRNQTLRNLKAQSHG